MKNVLRIFAADIRAVSRQFLAMAVVIAILFIPALYAWLNIYANWDPYGSTGNITIAVASEDAGYEKDGVYYNKGEELLSQLAEKTSIHFQVYPEVRAALEAAEAGKCYGAIIIERDFSRNMYDLASALRRPETTITFYENYKLNPVANKITESAASSVLQSVQTAYLEVVFETVFGSLKELVDTIDENTEDGSLLELVTRLRDASAEAIRALDVFTEVSTELADFLYNVDMSTSAGDLKTASGSLYATAEAVKAARDALAQRLQDASASVSGAQGSISGVDASDVSQAWIDSQRELFNNMLELADQMESVDPEKAAQLRETAQSGLDNLDQLEASGGNSAAVSASLELLSKDLVTMGVILDSLQEMGLTTLDGLSEMCSALGATLSHLGDVSNDITTSTTAAGDVIYALNDFLTYFRATMVSLNEQLDKLVEKAEDISEAQLMEIVRNILDSDPEKLAEFFAEPVHVETVPVYGVSSYGTAMAPFYSVLAIWVGCVVLAAVVKVEADPRELTGVTDNQLFWSRFILYLILNELQTMIILLGDLYLLKISCVHPGLFLLTGAFISLVFTALIYSLVLAFGDIGKAIVVVTMVLQIAGSGGTYPIEILTDVFSRLYLFFPFPYAINALRETICGLYQWDLLRYLGGLSVFGILGVLVGLYVRRPFMKLTEFIEEELEHSGVM